jgi:hypothetical protein
MVTRGHGVKSGEQGADLAWVGCARDSATATRSMEPLLSPSLFLLQIGNP